MNKDIKFATIGGNTLGVKIFAAMAAAILIMLGFIIFLVTYDNSPEVTNEMIVARLEKTSELCSAQLTYTGIIHYEDGKIPYITKKTFSMIYAAEIEAGIKLEDVDVDVTDTKVKISVPEIQILDLHILPDSIRFYDTKFSLFNPEHMEDTITAIKEAEADVQIYADLETLKVAAKEQTTILMENLFVDSIGDRQLSIEYR